MPTVDEYWDVDGFSLHEDLYRIETLSGRFGLPEYRGPNTLIPYRRGQRWRPKVAAERTLTLAMWLRGSTKTEWNEHYRNIVKAFYKPEQELVLTKRFLLPSGLLTVSARCEYAGGLDPAMTGRTLSKFGVDLLLNDPWFYGNAVNVVGLPSNPAAQEVTDGTAGVVVENPGLVAAEGFAMLLTINGPRTNPRVYVRQTGKPDVWVQYTGVIAAGEVVTLDIDRFLATHTVTATQTISNHIGKITHSGARPWLKVWPGTNRMYVTSSAGAGSVDFTFRPPYE